MPQIGAGVPKLLLAAALTLPLLMAGCGRSAHKEAELAAAPVGTVVAALSKNPQWKPGKCLCVGHYRADAVEDYPPGLLDAEFAAHPFLRHWKACEPYYGRKAKPAGCEAGMTDFICSVAERNDLPKDTVRVLCHVSGQSEALQKAGYLQDEYDVVETGSGLEVHPVSQAGSGKIHE